MEIGTLLVLLAIILAVVSYFVGDRVNGNGRSGALLTAAVVLGFVGVLLGVGDGLTA